MNFVATLIIFAVVFPSAYAGTAAPHPRSQECESLLPLYAEARPAIGIHSPRLEQDSQNPTHSPTLDEIDRNLYAVHATGFLPQDGVVRALASGAALGVHLTNRPAGPNFRCTIHFSLGELVRPHGIASWENLPYAIIVPFKSLRPQLVNILPQDTFILGDFKIPADGILVAPRNPFNRKEEPGVHYYNPRTTTLRQAVDDAIKSRNGWKVTMESDQVSVGGEAKSEHGDLSKPGFFRSVIKAHPYVSFGDHIASETGSMNRFGHIENLVQDIVETASAMDASVAQLRWETEILKHHLNRLREELSATPIPATSVAAFEQRTQDVMEWIHFSEALNRLREEKKLTIRDSYLLDKAMSLRSSPLDLENYLTDLETKNKLHAVLPEKALNEARFSQLTSLFAGFPLEEMKPFRKALLEIEHGIDPDVLDLAINLKRQITIRADASLREGLVEHAESLFRTLSTRPKEPAHLDWIFKQNEVLDRLEPGISRGSEIVAILARPAAREATAKHLGFSVPLAANSIESILEAHPDTRDTYLTTAEYQKHPAFPILQIAAEFAPWTLGRTRLSFREVSTKSPSAVRSYSRGRFLQEAMTGSVKDMIECGFGPCLIGERHSGQVSLEGYSHFWDRLGLKDAFLSRFQDASEFESSTLSLEEIRRALAGETTRR